MATTKARSVRAAAALAVAAALAAVAVTVTSGESDSNDAHRATTTSTIASTAPASTTTTSTTLPSVEPGLLWSGCGSGFECGTVTVPVDWSAPTGDLLPLAVIRHRADVPSARIGTLAVNCGGPGSGCVTYLRAALARLPTEIKNRFDILAWDPRGTGASRPIDCVDDGTLDRIYDIAPTPHVEADWKDARDYNALFARGCIDRSGAFARLVGTRNTARDLEQIRRAIGEPTISYLGFSYGALLGAVYADMFPTSLRALVLDGSADWWRPPVEYAYLQAQGFANALDAFLSWCETTTACALRRAGAPRAVFADLAAASIASPLPASYTAQGSTRAGRLTEFAFQSAVIGMLYDRRAWPQLGEALRLAAQDGDGGALLALADRFLGRNSDGTWEPLVESSAVIGCLDRPGNDRRSDAEEHADVARFSAELPPFGGSWATVGCVDMPRARAGEEIGEMSIGDVPPTLVVGTTGDPATPYVGSQAMAQRIAGSRLLTFEGVDHTAFGTGRSDCIDGFVSRYFVDLVLPPPDTRC